MNDLLSTKAVSDLKPKFVPIFRHIFQLTNKDAPRENTLYINHKTQALTKIMNMNI